MMATQPPIRPLPGPPPGKPAGGRVQLPKVKPKSSGNGLKTILVTTILVLATVIGFRAFSGKTEEHDPAYLQAVEMVETFERGKKQIEKDFNNQVYDDALAQLEKVSPTSMSAEPASQLASRILSARVEFNKTVTVRQNQLVEVQQAAMKRTEALTRGQIASTGIDDGAADRVSLAGDSDTCIHSDGTSHAEGDGKVYTTAHQSGDGHEH